MAFTEAQKTKIRYYLGYPNIHLTANVRLEMAITLLGDGDSVQAEIETILAVIATIEDKLSSTALDVAGIQAVGQGDPEFYKGQILVDLRNEGRRNSNKISIIAGVPIANDVWGQVGYSGDWWASENIQQSFPWS